MRGFEVAKVLVSKNLVENAVGIPGRAATHELSICCSKRVENRVVEVLVISNEIELIRIYYIKRWASDCFRVVRESLNAASVKKMNAGLLVVCGQRRLFVILFFWFGAKKAPLCR